MKLIRPLAALLLLLTSVSALHAGAPPGKTQQITSPDQVPEGLAKSDWASIRAAYEAGQHAFMPVEGGWQARNPGQQWTTKFDRRGFVAEPRGGGWQWGLELKGYGFPGSEREIAGTPAVQAEGQRLSYQWDAAVQEWFVNDARGLEHGFTVAERPWRATAPVATAGGAPALQFDLAVRGTLTPVVTADSLGVEFRDAAGATVLNYTGLKVWDADGKALASRFEAAGAGRVRLVVEESAARYPITIDPIAQQAYLKASNTGASDQFGRSVAVSGDTVVVGAYAEDSSTTGVNSTPNESAPGAGAAYVFVRSGTTWTQQAYLKASQVSASDVFGYSVAVSGDTVVVGAVSEDSSTTGINSTPNESASAAGAAYVFVRSGTTWSQQAYLKASQVSANDNFGNSVAVSGDTVVVGAWQEDSSTTGVNSTPNESATYAGAAYVFVRSGTTWSQQAYLKASEVTAFDYFGISVAVSGDTVVVGAYQEDSSTTGTNSTPDQSAPSAGAAYVFVRSGTTWTQQAYLKSSEVTEYDQFGISVAVSGDTVVVGANNEDSSTTGVNSTPNEGATDAGAAYVFTGFPVPQITVEQTVGTSLTDGTSSIDFGTVDPGASSAAKTFTITNTGTATLTLGTITKDGTNAGDFTVSTPGSTTVAPGSSTTFTVTFSPSGTGARSAAIHIPSNVTGATNPFDIALTGTGTSTVTPTFTTAGTVPVSSNGFTATGLTLGTVTLGFAPSAGQTLTLVDNTGASAVSGTFTGLPQGSVVAVTYGGTTYNFYLSYVGGTGNDIVLVAQGPGVLDYGFNGTGFLTTALGSGDDKGSAVAVQSDGKIVVAGSVEGANPDFAVVRYNADGTLDTSFGGTGKVTTDINSNTNRAYGVAIQSDGKIVAVGFVGGSTADFALVRYNADGTLDTGFGTGGKVVTPIGSGDDTAYEVALQSDGKIVVVGTYNNGTNEDFAVVRYNTNGTLDTTFNSTGKVTTAFGTSHDNALGVTVQADGKIVVVGQSSMGATGYDFSIARYNTNGSLDTTFDTDGKRTTDVATYNDGADAIALQTDGKILVGGGGFNGLNNDFTVVRYTVAGALDTTFGTGGIASFSLGADDTATSLAVQTDGRIVVGGYRASGGIGDCALARLNTDGSLDTTFNGTGKQVLALSSGDDRIKGVALQSDGSIVAAGYASNGSNLDFAVARVLGGPNDLLVNGSFESAETLGGFVSTSFGDWGQDQASIVTTENGITPYAGTRMAKFLGTSSGGASSTVGSEITQYVDLSTYASAIAAGSISVTVTGRVNRVTGNASTDTRFGLRVRARSGTVASPATLSENDVTLISDGNTATWELITNTLTIPVGTTHLDVAVYADENVVNDTVAPEFAGHYVDDVQLSVRTDFVTQAPTLTTPATNAVTKSPVSVAFNLPEAALPGSVKLSFGATQLTLAASQETAGAHSFSFDPANPTATAEIASGAAIVDGAYTVTLSYQDTLGNAAATAVSTNVTIDTTPPVLSLPANITVAATSPSGAVVSYTASASDSGSGVATSSFLPASGSNFPIGTTTVNASATDNVGNTVTGSFTVTVLNTAPTVTLIGANPLTFEASAAYTDPGATASDPQDGALTPTLTSNTVVANVPGAYAVTWEAMDSYGAVSFTTRTVNVVDTTPPAVAAHANVTVEATSAAGAVVNYAAGSAGDAVGVTSISYSKDSGETFPLGTTTVTITAKDAANNTGTGTFTVTVQDTEAPVVTVPANITTPATSAAGAVVSFSVSASDVVDGPLMATANPASGSTFPVGTTTVNVTATDALGHTGSASFTVTVLPSSDADLASLSVSGAVLKPAFDPAVTSYTATVGNATTTAMVSAGTAFPGATIVQTPANAVPLSVGNTPVSVRVTAQDGTTDKTYNVTVKRTVADATKTVVTITAPTTSAVTGAFTISGKVSEAIGLASVTVRLNGVALPLDTPLASDTGTAILFNVSGAAPENGTNTIVVEALDYNGNLGTATKTITYVNPALAGRAGTYSGVLVASPLPGDAPNVTSGLVTVTVGATGSFTGKVLLDGVSVPLSGVLKNDGAARFRPALGTSFELIDKTEFDSFLGALALSVDEAGGMSATLSTQASGGTVLAACTARVAPYTAQNLVPAALLNQPVGPSPTKGVYNVVFAGPPGVDRTDVVPGGSGIASITLKNSGAISGTGWLADGTQIAVSGKLRADGSFPVFAQIYRKRGSFGGELVLANDELGDIRGNLPFLWVRPPLPRARYFPGGWPEGLQVDALGMKYAAPASLNFGQGPANTVTGNSALEFLFGENGIEPPERFEAVSIHPGTGAVKPIPATNARYTLSLSTSTGLFSGTVTLADQSKGTFRGILQAKDGAGLGAGFLLVAPALRYGASGLGGGVFLYPGAP